MSEQMVKCPFNPMHILSKESLQRHIIRCMVNYPNYVTCPYNALHRFKNKELLCDHMLDCESREKFYLDYESNNEKTQTTCFHVENTRAFNLEEENWDED